MYIHRGTYTWRQYTRERTTKQGNIHTKETTRSGHDIEETPYRETSHGGYIIQRGYICKGDIYMEETYTQKVYMYMERTYIWRGYTKLLNQSLVHI